MMEPMKVSVIIPVYNAEEYLFDCLESIYSQTYKDIEVIAVNDGSTDNSIEVLNEVRKKYPDLVVITQENRGPGAGRNNGLKVATGEYVYFSDSDDIHDPNMIEDCMKAIKKRDCDVVGFQADIFGDTKDRDEVRYIYSGRCQDMNTPIDGVSFFLKYHKRIDMLNTPLLFFKRSFLLNNKLQFMEGVLHEDVEFYYRMINANPQLLLMDKTLYHRRYRKASIMTSDVSSRRLYDMIRVSVQIAKIEAKDEIKDIFLYDAIKKIRYSLDDINENRCLRDYKFEKAVSVFLANNLEAVLNSNLLTQCEFCLAFKNLVENVQVDEAPLNEVKKYMSDACDELGLFDDEKCVGIYGTGGVTDVFLNACELLMGEIPENVIYIDTRAKSGEKKYRTIDVMNYRDVDYNGLSSVLVSSELYEDQIEETIKKLGVSVPIYKLTDF